MVFLLFPIMLFKSEYVVLNLLTDLPIMVLINVLLLIFFLEGEIRRLRHYSIYLLIIAAVSVFSSFFRIIPLPMGITMAFLLPIASGFIFGPCFGFIIGQLSMLVGGLFLGAFGPWLPYQSFLMGFIGFYSGAIFHRFSSKKHSIIPIILYAVLVSFVYGYWMSIGTWPIVVKTMVVPDLWWEKIRTYNGLYFITSFIWDATRAAGNIVVFMIFFRPICELLERAKNRLTYYR